LGPGLALGFNTLYSPPFMTIFSPFTKKSKHIDIASEPPLIAYRQGSLSSTFHCAIHTKRFESYRLSAEAEFHASLELFGNFSKSVNGIQKTES
jgi:hypothetical protein